MSSKMIKFFKKKSEEQDLLNELLKAALPLIWHQMDLFKMTYFDDKDLSKYLPDGKDHSVEILLEGKWLIHVWKWLGYLEFEFPNKSAIDEGIRKTNFQCIASHWKCKYLKKVFFL